MKIKTKMRQHFTSVRIAVIKKKKKSISEVVEKREICMQVKKEQLELDMEQQTVAKSGKEYVQAVYCHPAYLTYMQGTS